MLGNSLPPKCRSEQELRHHRHMVHKERRFEKIKNISYRGHSHLECDKASSNKKRGLKYHLSGLTFLKNQCLRCRFEHDGMNIFNPSIHKKLSVSNKANERTNNKPSSSTNHTNVKGIQWSYFLLIFYIGLTPILKLKYNQLREIKKLNRRIFTTVTCLMLLLIGMKMIQLWYVAPVNIDFILIIRLFLFQRE